MNVVELETQLALGTIKFYTDKELERWHDVWLMASGQKGQKVRKVRHDDLRYIMSKLSAKCITYLLSCKQIYSRRYTETLDDLIHARHFNYTHSLTLICNRNIHDCIQHVGTYQLVQEKLVQAIREGKIGEIK